jgi:hypothetical protein
MIALVGSVPIRLAATIAHLTNNRSTSTAMGALTVVITLLGWSSVPLFLRYFADHIDFWTSNGWRYGFSALVWLPVLIAISMRSSLPKGLWKAALVPSLFNAAGQVLFTWAHYRIDPGLLTFGLRSQLIFVAIGAWLMFPQERAVIRTPERTAASVCRRASDDEYDDEPCRVWRRDKSRRLHPGFNRHDPPLEIQIAAGAIPA